MEEKENKNILLLVDVQNGFIKNLDAPESGCFEERISGLVNSGIFDVIVATQFNNFEHSMYEKLLGYTRMMTAEDCAFPDWLSDKIKLVAKKHRYSCMSASFLAGIQKLNDGEYPEKIFIAGLDTDGSVFTVATEFFDVQIRPIILEKYCVSSGGKECHEAGIIALKHSLGEKQVFKGEVSTREDLFFLIFPLNVLFLHINIK